MSSSLHMYTQCPACLTVFSVDAKLLVQARGELTCGCCETVFDALATLTAQLPPEQFQNLPVFVASESAPRIELAIYRPSATTPSLPDNQSATPGIGATEDYSQLVFTPRSAKSKPARTDRRWPWVFAILVLLLVLMAQLAWINRDRLIRQPTTGAWLRQTCAALGCRLPLVRDASRLRLLARDVQSSGASPGVLTISLTLRNDAPFDQPWPVLVITLKDLHNHAVAMRRLLPTDYIDNASGVRHGLLAGANAAVVVELQDPGQQAVNFDLSFE